MSGAGQLQPLDLEAQAAVLDQADDLRHLRDEFVIPTRADIQRQTLAKHAAAQPDDGVPCTYLCGNSLGLQPKRTSARIKQYLDTWGAQGVQGHFKPLEDSPLPTWLDADAHAAKMMAPVVGADESEVAVMQTLTANLHLLMTAFYRPDPKGRHKIILESKAFPSDHFAVISQIQHHGLSPETSMVTLESPSSEDNVLSTTEILSLISVHAADTALILLPGIQYYTGQLLDIPAITAFARQHGIFIIWDLAHAVGNVPLALHDWDVDAAAWCTYKYLNGGPGCIGGLFVHERNSRVVATDDDSAPAPAAEPSAHGGPSSSPASYRPRLAGWWGNDKGTRFAMATTRGFRPVAGAAGFQLSNPSILDLTSLTASLEVFAAAGGVAALHAKSRRLTAFLQHGLDAGGLAPPSRALVRILTPSDPDQRGAQLSLRLLAPGLLEPVLDALLRAGVVVDERKPDVIRVAPAPLYNSFADCVAFVRALDAALAAASASA